jgi:hypothetical protein
LLSFFHLDLSLIFHFASQSVDIFHFLVHIFFFLSSLSSFFIFELLVSRIFVIHNFILDSLSLFNFSLLEEFTVFFMHGIIHSIFLFFTCKSVFFRLNLFIKFIFNQSFSFGFS